MKNQGPGFNIGMMLNDRAWKYDDWKAQQEGEEIAILMAEG